MAISACRGEWGQYTEHRVGLADNRQVGETATVAVALAFLQEQPSIGASAVFLWREGKGGGLPRTARRKGDSFPAVEDGTLSSSLSGLRGCSWDLSPRSVQQQLERHA